MKKTDLVGLDTPFLLAHTLLEHPDHQRAIDWKARLLNQGRQFALCSTVCNEFLHVVTDHRRFERPPEMRTALEIIQIWMMARETVPVFPDEKSWYLQQDWMRRHRLGRKRILDTEIAAVYRQNGARMILTSNVRDFSVLEAFDILDVGTSPT